MDIHSQVVTIFAPWGKDSHVVLYLLKGDQIALVDTGANDTPESAIAPALAKHGLKLADIDLILNTHGHHDHAGGNSSLQSASGAKVFISEDENPSFWSGRRAKAEIFQPIQEVLGRERFNSMLDETVAWAGGHFAIDRSLRNGDVVDLGGGIELEIVSLPGHSPGSIGYYWREEGIMFAGDSMNGRGSKAGCLPIICDSTAYQESISRLMQIQLKTLCLCHNYYSFQLAPQAVRSGGEIRTFLDECNYVNNELRSAANRAVRAEPEASLWRQGERLLEELPTGFQVLGLEDVLRSLWSAMGVYSFIWSAREAK
jgi:hydroxyacylglutathione hydrolase